MYTSFIKCESKFIIFLLIGLILLNGLGFIFQYLFNSALLISIGMSIIIFIMYFLYFIFGIIKFIILKKEFKCMDINRRLASWLSSLV
jgi:hypothetical protein